MTAATQLQIQRGDKIPYHKAPDKSLVRELDGPTPGVYLFRDGELGVTVAFPQGMNATTGLYDPTQAHLAPHWGTVCSWRWDEAIRHAETVEVLMVDLPFTIPTPGPRAKPTGGAMRKLSDDIRALWTNFNSI